MKGHMEKGRFHPHADSTKMIHSSSINRDMTTSMHNRDREEKSLKVDKEFSTKIIEKLEKIDKQWNQIRYENGHIPKWDDKKEEWIDSGISQSTTSTGELIREKQYREFNLQWIWDIKKGDYYLRTPERIADTEKYNDLV